ncbi:hypothetical protein KHO59_gp060 [Mycobacterium phage Cane17]|uniref:Uncharacterized protein n=1 Tax=Mycobacterium phage Cane17 TaxID=2301548 RepID=A0A346N8N9_9CAUD|nr:hypothetical protein KHO59_gp060 [Mycobacterium phage Cane17]AXQ51674.1 hypothetical protein SEA_CANE17_60 [Mycobacterium phage Cane17]
MATEIYINYRIEWDIPEDDPTVQLGRPSHLEVVFDGAEGQSQGEERLQILREAEKRGMCSNIKVAHRRVTVETEEWKDGQP